MNYSTQCSVTGLGGATLALDSTNHVTSYTGVSIVNSDGTPVTSNPLVSDFYVKVSGGDTVYHITDSPNTASAGFSGTAASPSAGKDIQKSSWSATANPQGDPKPKSN